MAKPRKAFAPTYRPGAHFIRTMAGLLAVLGFLAGALTLLMISLMSSTVTEDTPVKMPGYYVSTAYGKLLAGRGNDEWLEVAAGDDLNTGLIYKTDKGASALIRSSIDEVETLVFPNTILTAGNEVDPANLTLVSGRIHVRTFNEREDLLTIEIRNFIATFSGRCSVFVNLGNSGLELKVQSGLVSLKKGDGSEKILKEGDIARIENDEILIEITSFLPVPNLVAPTRGTVFRKIGDSPVSVELHWSEVDNTTSYFVEIARDLIFRQVFATRRIEDTKLLLTDLENGRYYWRVTAIDRQGKAGQSSIPSPFNVHLMVTPDDGVVSAPNLRLTETSSQSNLVSIRGQTEPGARVVIFLESFGLAITEPEEILVSPTGLFRVLLEATETGEIQVVVQAFYRPEVFTQRVATVFLDF